MPVWTYARRRFAGIVVALLAAIAPASGSSELKFTAADGGGAPRSLSELRGALHAVVVWKASCAPCFDELAHLKEIAAGAPGWRFVTLALDDARTVAETLPAGAREVGEAWIARDEPTTVLARLNPDQPALPLTIAVDRRGRICARRVGLLGSDILNGWSAQCSK